MGEILYKIGDEVKIININKYSQWYIDKDKFANKTGKLMGFTPHPTYGEWIVCEIWFDENSLNEYCCRKQPGSKIKKCIVIYGCKLRKVDDECLIPM